MKRLFFILPILVLLSLAGAAAAQHSVLSQGEWYKIGIGETGVYRITTSTIPALSGESIDHIALYGDKGGQLSTDNRITSTAGLQAIPIDIQDNNHNGLFDGNDHILFYAEAVGSWKNTSDRSQHESHAYAGANYVFLGIGCTTGKRIVADDSSYAPTVDISTYLHRQVYERDLVNTHGSGQIWVGEKFSVANSHRSFTLSLPDRASDSRAHLRVGLAGLPGDHGSCELSVRSGGATNYITFGPSINYSTLDLDAPASSNNVSVDIDFSTSTNGAAGYLDFIELNALVPLRFSGSQMTFRSLSQANDRGDARFAIANAAAGLRVWDVTDLFNIKEAAVTTNGTTATFAAPHDKAHEYAAFNGTAFLSPISCSRIENQDIPGATDIDLVIVAHKDYLQQAQRLASLHEIVDGLNVLVLEQNEVFNEFSSGKADPMAVRSMMRLFYDRYTSHASETYPRYLLLFGKGTYDNRNILGLNQTTVVTYQSPTSFCLESSASVSDDPMGYLGATETGRPSESLDLGIGRLPAKSAAEADLMVDKIEAYLMRQDLDDETTRGDWRNFVALLSDDADPSCPGDKDFAESNEYAANLINARYPNLNIDKIYADAYQQQSGTIGSYYPDVNNALRQRINYGCLLLNYIGHGSDQYIGTERYMELSDMNAYSNHNRLPFFVTSTCSFGKYDRTDDICGAEGFLLSQNAGVGTIAAARPISHMKDFNTALVLGILDPANRIGDALRQTKNEHPLQQNLSITLLGDPALRLAFPKHEVVVTKINDIPISPSKADSAEVLSRVTIAGEIRDTNGVLQSDFTGLIFPIVYDRKTNCRTLANDNEGTEVPFTQQKNILYKGCDSVKNGRFEYSFVVPRDVAYQFERGKLSHYARSGNEDASGSYSNIYFGGFDESVTIRDIRPQIALFMGDSNFISGGLVSETPTMFAILEDSIGINSVGSGLGHDITATIDGNGNGVVVLNDFYETDLSNASRGYVTYQLDKLTPGRHTLTVKAWNIFNYSSTATIAFVVKGSDSISIGRFFNYPNPARERTTIHVEHNIAETIASASIDIFDTQGQRVRHITPTIVPGTYTLAPVVWNYTSDGGATLSGSLYFARVTITTASGETYSSATKIVKIN